MDREWQLFGFMRINVKPHLANTSERISEFVDGVCRLI